MGYLRLNLVFIGSYPSMVIWALLKKMLSFSIDAFGSIMPVAELADSSPADCRAYRWVVVEMPRN
jgi:hypothetical protein